MGTVVLSLLGTTLDKGFGNKRWDRWRPSVAVCQHDDLVVDTYHLIYSSQHEDLAYRVMKDIRFVSPETKIIPHIINMEDPWDFAEVFNALHDFAETQEYDTEENDYLVHITTGTHVAQICLFLLTESRHFPARLLQTSPARHKNSTAPGTFSIIDLDLSKYDIIASRFAQETADDISYLKAGIETKNSNFNSLIARIEEVALHSDDPMLLTGPTGAGKSSLARRIYELKHHKGQVPGEFVEVNCATLRGDAAMSTLFGHKKGAFTGAIQDRQGLLRAAHKGIIFLDEIGELGLDEQAMLLRAIEEKRFMPVGADKDVSSEFQLICGTNRDLRKRVGDGEFREDLLARINLWTFCMPSLVDRPEDIEPNIRYELARFTREKGRKTEFNREAFTAFLKFAISPQAKWTANFRDLSAAMTRMCTLAKGGRITLDIVKEEIGRLKGYWQDDMNSDKSSPVTIRQTLENYILPETIDRFYHAQLADVIQICKESPNLSQAGRILFAESRKGKQSSNDADRLKKYLAKFGLGWTDFG